MMVPYNEYTYTDVLIRLVALCVMNPPTTTQKDSNTETAFVPWYTDIAMLLL